MSILEKNKDDPGIIHELASYVLSEQDFINESDEAAGLLNAIADVVEGRESSFEHVLQAFSCYWISHIRVSGVTIFYIGNTDNLNQLKANLDSSNITDIYYLPGSDRSNDKINQLMLGLNTAVAPLVIYDPEGIKFIDAANVSQALAVVPYYDLMFFNQRLTAEVKHSHAAWLERKYHQAKSDDVQTLIIGNSYGYYAFPEQITQRAVNLSMHSLSIKQAHALVMHALGHLPHIKHFVFCFGLFDLYCDLLRTRDNFNKSIIDSFSLFFSDNKIALSHLSSGNAIRALSSLIIVKNDKLQTSWSEDYLNQVYNATTSLITNKAHLNVQQHNNLAMVRAQAHSKLAKHHAVLEENKILLQEMLNVLQQNERTAAWLVPPFPALYVQNINEDMKKSSRQFLEYLGNENLQFIDWSENKYFERKHFRDGDHLNYSGAQKVVIKLRKAGVPL